MKVGAGLGSLAETLPVPDSPGVSSFDAARIKHHRIGADFGRLRNDFRTRRASLRESPPRGWVLFGEFGSKALISNGYFILGRRRAHGAGRHGGADRGWVRC
ncbi:hypothetical protein BJL95_17550 [Methylomonas sp. LWB]|nr:hypothetical protein BJL95_17550 [Methylomonas sp. LWB]